MKKNKIFRRILTFVLALMMVLNSSSLTFAAESISGVKDAYVAEATTDATEENKDESLAEDAAAQTQNIQKEESSESDESATPTNAQADTQANADDTANADDLQLSEAQADLQTADADISNGRYIGPYYGLYGGNQGDFTLLDKGAGKSYVAYCYNMRYAPPNESDKNPPSLFVQKPYVNADAETFYRLAAEGESGSGSVGNRKNAKPYTNDPELLKRYVLWAVYAGYPYNASGTDYYAQAGTVKRFKSYTQEAIWYFTDYEEMEYAGTYGVAKKIVDYAKGKAEAGLVPPITLDLFPVTQNSIGAVAQNLLVTQLTPDEALKPVETTVDVPIYKYEKYQTVDGTWVTSKMPIPGITFTLTKAGDSSFSQKSTSDKKGTATFTGLKEGTYTITETSAPGWNGLTQPIQFKVDANGNIKDAKTTTHRLDYEVNEEEKEIYIYNGHNAITFNKVDEDLNGLGGAEFTLEWIPTASGNGESNTTNREAIFKQLHSDDTFDDFDGVTWSKRWFVYDQQAAGDAENGTWTSSADGGQQMTLPDGVYRLSESAYPEGYAKIDNVGFILKTENGVQNIYVYQNNTYGGYIYIENGGNVISNGVVDIVDQVAGRNIKICKINEGGEELPDAYIQIFDVQNNQIVDEFVTDGTMHELMLQDGDYMLHEEKAPEGYEAVPDVYFEVTEKGIEYYGADEDHVYVDDNDTFVLNIIDLEKEISLISVEGEKSWVGDEDYPEARPESITVGLYQNGQFLESKDVTADNDWKYEFTDLPEFDDAGNYYTYTVQEEKVPEGYQSRVLDNNDIENVYTPEKVKVKVTKVWDDNNNQDGIRPSSVRVQLFANGAATGKYVTLSNANHWESEFADLQERANGADIVYTVEEELAEDSGYTCVVGETVAGEPKHITITNSHTPETIAVAGTKTWNDANDQDGKRPTTITIALHKNGKEIQTATTSEADGWKYEFKDLPKYENGREITYTVSEKAVPQGYQSSVNGYDITNSYTPGKVTIQVEKAWDDKNDQDGIRANDVTVYLYANGSKTNQSVVLNEANNWSASFKDLDEMRGGKPIQYTVSEKAITGYTASITTTGDSKHFRITNHHTPETVNVAGSKTWDDADDQDGKRPDYIEVQLLANNIPVKTVRVTEADKWEWNFTNLAKKENGKEIKYSVREASVPEGYQSSVNGYNITNTYTPNQVAVNAKKVWVDNNNQDGIRPQSITVHLYADGVDTGKMVLLNEGNNWEASFTDLPENKSRLKVVYSVKEDPVAGYSTEYTTDDAAGRHFTIANTHTPETIDVAGIKSWNDADDQDGKRPKSVVVILKKAGQEVARKTATVEEGWKYEFKGLPKYENNGSEIRYTVQEGSVPEGYQSTVNGYNITNTYTPGQVAIQVAKSWIDNDNQDGIRPNSVTVHLFANGKDTGKTASLNEGNGWIADFENLDEYEDGEKIVYTVTEDAVTGYKTTITTGADEKHFTVTNTHSPELIRVSGTKSWNDADDQDGKRPESVEIILKRAGQEVARKTVTAKNGWNYVFENLPKYENNGSLVRYTVQEGTVPEGYQSSVNGYNITNNYTPGKVAIQVAKSWKDNNNQDGIRPNSVTVHLLANGEDTGKTVILNAGNKWIAEFADLDEYDDGEKIVYTVTEDTVSGYDTTITNGADEKHFTITNTHTPETIDVAGIKSWNDADDQDGKRPENVVIILKKAGQEIARKTVSVDDGWKYEFKGLPKYENNGSEIRYTVQEGSVPEGYQSSVNGYNITNNYTPGKVAIQVAKSWKDNDNQDGVRPNSVTVHLFADGVDTGKTVILNAGNGWIADFENLDEYDDGEKIVYTVTEDTVNGYDTTITTGADEKHFTITNTHTPETIDVEGTKSWNDGDNQDGNRPTSVVVILKKAGQEIARKTVSERTNWKYSFTNLPKYENNGSLIRYSVQEGSVPEGYQSTVNGYDITNNYTPNQVAVQVAKSWIDNDNQDGIRPNSITVHLLADGVDTGKTVILNAANNWIGEFSNLDEKRLFGRKIVYTVTEDAVNGYETTITAGADEKHFTITNTHTPEVVRVAGTKSWNDADDQDGKRPESVVIILKKAGQEIARKTVTEADGWNYEFTNLPKYENNGSMIRYTVQEGTVPEGYQSSVSGYNITNNYTPGKVAIQVAKSWKDNDNQDGIRPNSVTVHLFANGKDTGETAILNAGNRWIAEFADLDEYGDGEKIVYTVTEDAVNGYHTTITTGADEKHFTITNTHTPEVTSVNGTKIWNDANDQDGKRPQSVEIILKKGGQEIARKTVTAETNWKYSFTNLPKYENNGALIRYTVQEGAVAEGYQSSVDGYDITNSYTPGKVAIQVAKSWIDNDNQDGIRPTSVTIHLLANNLPTGKSVVLSADNNWIADFADLDEKAGGKTINYTVTEDTVGGYNTTITQGADARHFTVTNTHTPETIDVAGTKSWNDANDQDGMRPESVVIILKKAGQEIARKTVTAADGWKYEFKNLPKYENNGSEIRYSVQEGAVPEGYQSSVKGYDITNSYTPGKIAIQVAKSWQDENNYSGIRPNKVIVWLYKNGVKTDQSVELSQRNNWIANFADLDEYENGRRISYTVVEDAVREYATTYDTSQDGRHITITNSYTPEFVNVNVEKQWKDKDDLFSQRPASIKLGLYQEYEGVYYWVAYGYTSEADDWKYTFEKLPKYVYDFENQSFEYDANGNKKEITYVVKEEDVPEGYLADPTITQTGVRDFVIENKLDDKEVPISKTDIGGQEIAGAKLTITDEKGTVVDSWTSKADEIHKAYIPAGNYTLTEVLAPQGYETAESIAFTVDGQGQITVNEEPVDKVTMVDEYSDQKVTLSKTDITGTKEIASAELELMDARGNVVASWISEEDKSHELMVQPGVYVMTETTAPQGYKVAESISFEVTKEGEIRIISTDDNGNTTALLADKVVMKDDYENGKVIISKTDVAGKEIADAKLEIIDQDGNVVEQWTSVAEKNHEVSLYPGTYTLKETTAPNGYELAESITFTVDQNNVVTVDGNEVGKVHMVDAYSDHKVIFSKTNIGGEELKGATIRLLDEAGKEVDKWVTTGKAKEFELQPGTYTFEETAAPEGYELATAIRFTVNADGTITCKDVKMQGDDENLIVMIDAYKVVPKETPKETPKTTPTTSSNNVSKTPLGTSTTGKVRTGDTANALIWFIILGLASSGIVIVTRRRKVSNN